MPRASRRNAPPDTPAARRILGAAESCFGTLGFRKTSVMEIAAAAQVSKPLVYRYFASKEALYEVVVRGLVDAWNEELVAALFAGSAGAGPAADALREMHRSSLAFARRSSLLQGLLARDSRTMLATYSDVVERSIENWRGQICERLERGVRAGEVRRDIPVVALAHAVTELHLAYAERVVAGRDDDAESRMAEAAFQCLIDGMAAPQPA